MSIIDKKNHLLGYRIIDEKKFKKALIELLDLDESWECGCCRDYDYQNTKCKRHNCRMIYSDYCSYFKRATSNDKKEKKD